MSNAERDPKPTVQTPVVALLGGELEARGWSQADFAAVLDRAPALDGVKHPPGLLAITSEILRGVVGAPLACA